MSRAMRVVQVDWVDASSQDRWRGKDKLYESELLEVRSIGFVIRSNRKEVVLAQSRSELDNVCNTIAIPRYSIRKIRPMGRR